MPMKPPPSDSPTAPQLSPGIYPGILVSVIYLGRTIDVVSVGRDGKWCKKGTPGSVEEEVESTKIRLEWEVAGQEYQHKDKTYPRIIGEDFPFYWGGGEKKSKLRLRCEGMAGNEIEADEADIYDLLGRPCMLNICHNKSGEKTYTNIAACNKWPADQEPPLGLANTIKFDFDENLENFAKLPQWIKRNIMRATDFPAQHNQQKTATSNGEEAPQQQSEEVPF